MLINSFYIIKCFIIKRTSLWVDTILEIFHVQFTGTLHIMNVSQLMLFTLGRSDNDGAKRKIIYLIYLVRQNSNILLWTSSQIELQYIISFLHICTDH